MTYLSLICSSVLLLSSCRKDSREFTSDFPRGYRTDIIISYNEYWNKTWVQVGFSTPYPYNYYPQRYLLLPPGSYVKCNGVELVLQPGTFYQADFEGKQICTMEFKDYDGIIYTNTMIPPDTVYFINLPDTISSFKDFQLQVNPPDPDSNEFDGICLDSHGDDYGCWYFGTDSLIDAKYFPSLESGMNHSLYLYRYKFFSNPDLPFGGGSVEYQYVVTKTFYTP